MGALSDIYSRQSPKLIFGLAESKIFLPVPMAVMANSPDIWIYDDMQKVLIGATTNGEFTSTRTDGISADYGEAVIESREADDGFNISNLPSGNYKVYLREMDAIVQTTIMRVKPLTYEKIDDEIIYDAIMEALQNNIDEIKVTTPSGQSFEALSREQLETMRLHLQDRIGKRKYIVGNGGPLGLLRGR